MEAPVEIAVKACPAEFCNQAPLSTRDEKRVASEFVQKVVASVSL
jgi:hypothetical protein